MKKLIIFGSMVLGLITTNVLAEEEVSPEHCFKFSSNTITGYMCGGKNVVIPAFIDGSEVKIIGDLAFARHQLISVVIPNSVRSIGNWAFSNNQLTSIIIPDSVKEIGFWAFSENTLTSVVIGTGVSISDRQYGECDEYDGECGVCYGECDRFCDGEYDGDCHREYYPVQTMGTYDAAFRALYASNGQLAGTYTYEEDGSWIYSKE